MKITIKKNLAFRNQPEPLLAKDVKRKIKAKKPAKPLKSVALDLDLLVPTYGEAEYEIREAKRSALAGRGSRHLQVRVENFSLGEHAFPPTIRSKGIKELGDKARGFNKPLETTPLVPAHLAVQTVPRRLPAALRTPPFHKPYRTEKDEKRGNQATTVFPPDQRMVFSDTAYPWCTCGRVDTPMGQSSGVMVGPRHMVTVSHAIQWNADGTAGWVQFRPSYFNGSTPFGTAWGTRVYFKRKVTGPTIDWIEGMYDYVCVVLDRRIGDWTGWMGSRGYTDSWDGGSYWAHIGYPGDLTAGNRPTFQNSISLDGAWWQFDSHESMGHVGDVWPGQSGGPFFGWWAGEVGPRIVSVQSSQTGDENYASGGQDMVDLIIRALGDHP